MRVCQKKAQNATDYCTIAGAYRILNHSLTLSVTLGIIGGNLMGSGEGAGSRC